MKQLVISTIVFILSSSAVIGANIYITPDGTGTKDGSSWRNAMSYNKEHTGLQKAVDQLKPGNTLYIGGGVYKAKPFIFKAIGKSKGQLTCIKGVTQNGKIPTFTGTWDKRDKNKGFSLVTIAPNSTWWSISNLNIVKCRDGIRFARPGRCSNGFINNINMTKMREGIILDGGATVMEPKLGSHDIIIENFRIEKYTKRGVRIKNGCYNITFKNCFTDAGGQEWATEPFHMGFSVTGGAEGIYDHDISFINCEARNNYHNAGKGYWNADGFCAEDNVYNLTYIGCKSFDNTDGGWDDKSPNPLLIGCVAMRNKKNYRFWSGKPGALLIRCLGAYSFKRGGNSESNGLWTKGKIRIIKSSFVNNDYDLKFNDWRLKPGDKEFMSIKLIDSIVTIPNSQKEIRDKVEKINSVIWKPGAQENESMGYSDPEKAKKLFVPGTAFDSKKYGKSKGYNSCWNNENLLTESRKLQPFITKKVKKLKSNPIILFKDNKPSGWYFSGWKGVKMKIIRGNGKDSKTCMGVIAESKTYGGATYRTKRASASIDLTARDDADWKLKFYIKGASGQSYRTPMIGVYNLNKSTKTKNINIPAIFDGSNSEWQEVVIPLKNFLKNTEAKFDSFAGIMIRSGGNHKEPLYIDNITLEP